MKTRIHVNQHNIRANAKGADLPVLTVKTYKENVKCNRVAVHGPSTVVYSPDKPLSCGAKVWVETEAEVTVDEVRLAKDSEEIVFLIQTTNTALNALALVNKSFDADHIAEITEEADAVALVAERFYGINVDFSEQLSKIKVKAGE
tara:strand:+ start:116 stop:553 length:438 start_codon:yes stop_codon:yes gene_type:complete